MNDKQINTDTLKVKKDAAKAPVKLIKVSFINIKVKAFTKFNSKFE